MDRPPVPLLHLLDSAVRSDCSKPLPIDDLAILLQRKCWSPPPARAGPRLLAASPCAPWAKNLLMAIAASIRGKNLGCASQPHSSPSWSAHHWHSALGVPLSISRTAPWQPSGSSSSSRRCPRCRPAPRPAPPPSDLSPSSHLTRGKEGGKGRRRAVPVQWHQCSPSHVHAPLQFRGPRARWYRQQQDSTGQPDAQEADPL